MGRPVYCKSAERNIMICDTIQEKEKYEWKMGKIMDRS